MPLRILTRFITLSNPLWTHQSSLELYTFYHLWKEETDTLHHAMYYNVGQKKMCWINGTNLPQHDPVTTEEEEDEKGATGIPLGFECTAHGDEIIDTLNALSEEEFAFNLFH